MRQLGAMLKLNSLLQIENEVIISEAVLALENLKKSSMLQVAVCPRF
jgi:hypothetical protein